MTDERETIQLIDKLCVIGMSDALFKKIHHFSQPAFRAPPTSINTHSNYCRNHSFDPDPDENRQTLHRLREVYRLRETEDMRWQEAITAAWRNFPLVTR